MTGDTQVRRTSAAAAPRTTAATPPGATRGVYQPMHPVVLGSVVGAVGGSVFVHVNRGGLPAPWPFVSLVGWGAALLVFGWVVLVRRRVLPDPPPPARRAGLTYGAAVLGMLAVMRLGLLALGTLGREDLQPAVVVLAVGLHFIPFERAFHAPVFGVLGAVVAVLGVVGLVGGALFGTAVALAVAVVTGIAMLLVVALDQLRA